MSPITFPVRPSTTMTCVPRDTKTRPVPGAAVAADAVFGDMESLRRRDVGNCQPDGQQKRRDWKADRTHGILRIRMGPAKICLVAVARMIHALGVCLEL